MLLQVMASIDEDFPELEKAQKLKIKRFFLRDEAEQMFYLALDVDERRIFVEVMMQTIIAHSVFHTSV
jgi:hypothetical protein